VAVFHCLFQICNGCRSEEKPHESQNHPRPAIISEADFTHNCCIFRLFCRSRVSYFSLPTSPVFTCSQSLIVAIT
jgi:hypothetical protein